MPDKTIVTLLLDNSGWMNLVKEDVVQGMNAFLDRLEAKAGDLVELTILQYDSLSIDALCHGATPADAPRFTAASYRPRGCPAFLDGCLAAIRAAEDAVVRRGDKPNVVVVLHVGGDDSSLFGDDKTKALREIIERRQAEGWQVVLIGSEVNPYFIGEDLGIPRDTAMSCKGTVGTLHGMTAAALAIAAFAHDGSECICITDEQRQAAGDRDYEFVISNEAIERSMRVYTPDEIMDHLRCITPSQAATTERWEQFLAQMEAGPQTPAAAKAIDEARKELAFRAAGGQHPAPPVIHIDMTRMEKPFANRPSAMLPSACPYAALNWPPKWAKDKFEEGEVVCCRSGMHFLLRHDTAPPLCAVAGHEVYRVLYEQAFGEHAHACFSRTGGEVRVRGAYHAGMFDRAEPFDAILTMDDWRLVLEALMAADFWSLPAYVDSHGGYLDGHDVMIEGRRGNLYRATKLSNPDVEVLWRIGHVAFDLARLRQIRL